MQIEIKSCNNIDSGIVQIVENRLNIKYAINGTGKSTVAKAICNSVLDRENGTDKLSELSPFKALANKTIKPTVTGEESVKSVKIFDENYINEFIFQPDELLKGSFDIFIRDADYDAGMEKIEALVTQIKTLLDEDQEIEQLISDFNELSGSFGRPTKTGIHGSCSLAKAFKKGNKVINIPEELDIYRDYIQDENNFRWIKWQLDGQQFIDITNNCPYCVSNILAKKPVIKKVGEIYQAKAIEHLNNIISVFQSLNKYFSENTRNVINKFIKNVNGYTDEQVGYLREVKDQIDRLSEKLIRVKNIGFSSFKDVDKIIERLKSYIIDKNLYNHLQSEATLEKISTINQSINQLLDKAGELQGKVNLQKRLIEKLVNTNKEKINAFLCNAGYRYRVDLIEDEKGPHKLKLIHIDLENEVRDVKVRLSYGERNAFALVLFMFDALKSKPDLIVLDDPISSFDKNKKYAMVDMLFRKEQCLRGKTVLLLSHDFEPIVDMVYHHSDRFDRPFATFLENKNGILSEKEIRRSDIQTFIEINEANISSSTNIVSKLVYLRRIYEITNSRGMAYQLVSNIFHKRAQPIITWNTGSPQAMTSEEIAEGAEEIKQSICDFDYQDAIRLVLDDLAMKNLYRLSNSNYEKLHIYRIIFDDREDNIQSDVIQKFINQAFHIENDYIYQLNPATFQTVPQYVIDECDKLISYQQAN